MVGLDMHEAMRTEGVMDKLHPLTHARQDNVYVQHFPFPGLFHTQWEVLLSPEEKRGKVGLSGAQLRE